MPNIRCCYNCAWCVSQLGFGGEQCECNHEFIGDIFNHNCTSFILVEQNNFLFEQWKEFQDVPIDNNEKKELVLANDWWLFKKGDTQMDIWEYFDKLYFGGINELMNREDITIPKL